MNRSYMQGDMVCQRGHHNVGKQGLSGKITSAKSQRGIERSGTARCRMDPAVWLEGWVDLVHLHQIRVNPDSGEL